MIPTASRPASEPPAIHLVRELASAESVSDIMNLLFIIVVFVEVLRDYRICG
jgi:hypothetical protein